MESERIDGRRGRETAAGRGTPLQDAGFWLFQPPSFGLFAPVVVPAQRGDVTGAGDAAQVPGGGVVLVAPGGRPPAAGGGTSGVTGVDQVSEGAAGPVGTLSLGVVARAADHRDEGEVERSQELRGQLARGPAVLAGGAGVGGGGAVGAQGGDAPAGLWVPGRGGDQGTGVLGVDEAESVGFTAGSGVTVPGSQGHGNGDLRGQTRTRVGLSWAAGTVRAGPAWPVRPGAGAAVPVRVGVRGRVGEGGAAVAFLEEIEVGLGAQFP